MGNSIHKKRARSGSPESHPSPGPIRPRRSFWLLGRPEKVKKGKKRRDWKERGGDGVRDGECFSRQTSCVSTLDWCDFVLHKYIAGSWAYGGAWMCMCVLFTHLSISVKVFE